MMKKGRGKGPAVLIVCAALLLSAVCPASAAPPWEKTEQGWVSADGKTVIRDAVERGMTISKYQNRAGVVNWKQIVRDNISFVMVRLGYYNDMDPYFDANMKGAEGVGIKAGVCFYGEALSVEDARREAEYVLEIVKDYTVSYPIAYDISSQYIAEQGFSRRQITDMANAFCEVIEAAGYRAAVYGDNDWLNRYLDVSRMPYDIWYSRYGMANAYQNRTLWRCTDSGRVSGVTGNVCLEFSFEDYKKTYEGTGWRTIGGTRYYFSNYRMVKNTTVKIGDTYYSFDENGICVFTR